MDADWGARLDRAHQALRKLERIRQEYPTPRLYQANSDTIDVAERNIQVAVEAVIDLANLLIAQRSWPRAASATQTVQTIVDQGALSSRLGTSLIRWIKTRNVLVHEYAAIDAKRVHLALRRFLPALREGIRSLALACDRAK